MIDYKNFKAQQKHEEKLEVFTACFFIILILSLLIVISAVGDWMVDTGDLPAYLAVELKHCEVGNEKIY